MVDCLYTLANLTLVVLDAILVSDPAPPVDIFQARDALSRYRDAHPHGPEPENGFTKED